MQILLFVTLANYAAQIPYYLYNYYFPYNVAPSIRGVFLLGLTLIWFLAGYIGYRRGKKWGKLLLVSFLLVEALFYLGSVASGAFFFQLQEPRLVIRIVFLIGYVSAGVSAYFVYKLLRSE